jgi:hypothetical protein
MPSKIRLLAALAGTLLTASAAPAVAGAATETTLSANWSGYAVHHPGTSYRNVTASWRQPAGTCSAGHSAYSAFWVGLGGFSLSSKALEQIGTELDCSARGRVSMSAWYELVPAPSRPIRMTLRRGDLMTATVSVRAGRVTLTLIDRTRHERFRKTIVDHVIDVGSAEWIAEAPSACYSATRCQTLPLADFGDVAFTGAGVTTTQGLRGSILSPLWTTTKIVLGAAGRQFVSTASAEATPSVLTGDGRAFSVSYAGTSSTSTGATAPGGGYASVRSAVRAR